MNQIIEGLGKFNPKQEIISGQRFSIFLDKKFASRLFEQEISKEVSEELQETGKNKVSAIFPHESAMIEPYWFLDNNGGKLTYLLSYAQFHSQGKMHRIVWTNYLDVSNYVYQPDFRSNPIETKEQAGMALSLWLNWFDKIKETFEVPKDKTIVRILNS